MLGCQHTHVSSLTAYHTGWFRIVPNEASEAALPTLDNSTRHEFALVFGFCPTILAGHHVAAHQLLSTNLDRRLAVFISARNAGGANEALTRAVSVSCGVSNTTI